MGLPRKPPPEGLGWGSRAQSDECKTFVKVIMIPLGFRDSPIYSYTPARRLDVVIGRRKMVARQVVNSPTTAGRRWSSQWYTSYILYVIEGLGEDGTAGCIGDE